MRTTIDINDALLSQIRERARTLRQPVKKVVEDVIRSGFSNLESAASAEQFKVEPHALGLKPAFRGQSLNQLYDQLESESTAR